MNINKWQRACWDKTVGHFRVAWRVSLKESLICECCLNVGLHSESFVDCGQTRASEQSTGGAMTKQLLYFLPEEE